MKLKQVTGSSQSKAKSAPTVSLNFLNGRIYFNAPTVQLLGLKEGDSLAFYQDEENPKDWYFTKAKIDGSVQLRDANKALAAFNGGIARRILQSVGRDGTAGFFIAEEKVEGKYWRILTDRAIKN